MHLLHNDVQHYRWGSRTHIADLCRRDFGGERVAEMWFGAHPVAPSRLDDGISLQKAIEVDPVHLLGPLVSTRHAERLPYLMKLLAADEPLSLQVHPRRADAEAGYAAEEGRGIPPDDPDRTYRDPSHKPELIYALTPFTALIGLRDRDEAATMLRSYGLAWLDGVADALSDPAVDIATIVSEFLHLSRDVVATRVTALREAGCRCVDAATVRLVEELAPRYPDDPAVLVALLLNVVQLAPGKAAFVAPGVIHSHVRGFAVEIQASSDNVVRAGLTPKHVDPDLLLRTADFSSGAPVLVTPRLTRGLEVFSPPVEEFELLAATLTGDVLPLDDFGPRIVLCLDGDVSVSCDDTVTGLRSGDAVLLTHGEAAQIAGAGRVVVARVPR